MKFSQIKLQGLGGVFTDGCNRFALRMRLNRHLHLARANITRIAKLADDMINLLVVKTFAYFNDF